MKNVLKYKTLFYEYGLYWGEVSSNKNIKIEDIINNPKIPWDFHYVSRNPNL